MDELVESHQHELASLQEVHRTQLSSIVRSYENKQKNDNDDGWGENSDWGQYQS